MTAIPAGEEEPVLVLVPAAMEEATLAAEALEAATAPHSLAAISATMPSIGCGTRS